MHSIIEEGFKLEYAKIHDEAKRNAFDHVVSSIDRAASLPGQVFLGNWNAFLFFESARLFTREFATIAAGLLNAEGAEICCLLNFSRTERAVYESAAMLFLDAEMKPDKYNVSLREGGESIGWLFDMEQYGSASDRGGWCIYCEKWNDVAVIALRHSDDIGKYIEYLEQLYAKPITVMLADPEAPFPFWGLVGPWRHGLVQHYGVRDVD